MVIMGHFFLGVCAHRPKGHCFASVLVQCREVGKDMNAGISVKDTSGRPSNPR